MRVVVVGGGIAGLAAAWSVARQAPEFEVIVLEAADRVGGKLRLDSVGGHTVDVGAEAMLARRPEGIELAREVGLGADLIEPLTTAARVRAGGAAHPLPARTVMGVPADLDAAAASGTLSAATLARLAAEPADVPLPPLEGDVAVGLLVRRRLGDEVVDRLVEPLLGGVYAGRADELSLRATVPGLAQRLSAGGSLVGAARQALAGADAGNGAVFASIAGGMGRLPRALASSGAFTVRTGLTVRTVRRTATGFELDCGPVPHPEAVAADAVIVATPAAKAATLLSVVAPAASTQLSTIDSASMAIVTFAFGAVDLPPGSGLLIGSREGFAVKAVTLSSQKWPGTPSGTVLLRASVGRAGETRDLQRDDGELIALVHAELGELLSVEADPVDAIVTRWGAGLPQYAVGHLETVERVRAAVAAVPGLAVCGATYEGVGIPACIASGQRAAAHVVTTLRAREQ